MTLLNLGFEPPYTVRENASNVLVAVEWMPWYVENPAKTIKRPEYRAETPDIGKGRVHSGQAAQKIFTTFAHHDGGVWQKVTVKPGQWYCYSAWAWIWTSKENNPDVSQNGGLVACVGANPYGHYWDHINTVWGKPAQAYDSWQKVEVVFQAFGNEVSLFVRSKPDWAVWHNDTYWDDATLEEIAAPGEQPEPQPEPEPGEPTECKFDEAVLENVAVETAKIALTAFVDGLQAMGAKILERIAGL